MTPQPSQPDQPQYLISVLNLFPVYASRAAYQQSTGRQAPPFNPALPVKEWADPNPSGQPYLYFDSTNAAGGYISQLTLPSPQAASVNLPGAYNYPPYVSPPTTAQIYGPSGPVGLVSQDQICLLADAQAILSQILPILPSAITAQTPSIGLLNFGPFYYVWGTEQRRPWTVLPAAGWSGSGVSYNCQTLIEEANSHGLGAPGAWSWEVCPNPQASGPVWTYRTPATQPPAGQQPVPTAIRPLLANEKIVNIPSGNPLFNPAGTWVVERTDLTQPQPPETEAQDFTDIKNMLQMILNKVGA